MNITLKSFEFFMAIFSILFKATINENLQYLLLILLNDEFAGDGAEGGKVELALLVGLNLGDGLVKLGFL